jgi:hypothetical protein
VDGFNLRQCYELIEGSPPTPLEPHTSHVWVDTGRDVRTLLR